MKKNWGAILLLVGLLVADAALALDAQKIAEIKASGPQSLWAFLAVMPGSFEAQIFYGLVLAGTVGVVSSYVYQWLKGEIAGSLVHYLFIDHVRGTLLSFAVLTGQALSAVAMGVFEGDDGLFTGWKMVMYSGVLAGFTGDVIVNKGKKPA